MNRTRLVINVEKLTRFEKSWSHFSVVHCIYVSILVYGRHGCVNTHGPASGLFWPYDFSRAILAHAQLRSCSPLPLQKQKNAYQRCFLNTRLSGSRTLCCLAQLITFMNILGLVHELCCEQVTVHKLTVDNLWTISSPATAHKLVWAWYRWSLLSVVYCSIW